MDADRKAKEEVHVKEIIATAVPQKLSKDEETQITRIMNTFNRTLHQLVKARQRHERYGSEINQIKDGRVPIGSKPFKVQFESLELDMEGAWNEDTGVSINFPKGMTFRAAKERLHLGFLEANKRLDQMMNSIRLDTLQRDADYTTFIDQVKGIKVNPTGDVERLGIPVPPGLFPPSTDLGEEAAMKIYRGILEKIAKEHVEQEKAKKDEEKRRKTLIDEAASLNPRDLIVKAVKQAVKEEVKAAGKGRNANPIINGKTFAVDHLSMFANHTSAQDALKEMDTKPKNGAAPGEGQGKAKGKSKDKSKGSTGKASGKGAKGQAVEATKGKGKSKGKGKHQKGSEQPKGQLAPQSGKAAGGGKGKKGKGKGTSKGSSGGSPKA